MVKNISVPILGAILSVRINEITLLLKNIF